VPDQAARIRADFAGFVMDLCAGRDAEPVPPAYATEINRLRNVIQAACLGGTDLMLERWKQLFPDAPVPTVKAAAPAVSAPADRLVQALRGITPPMPPADAPCHLGIVTQDECAHCRRIAAARAVLAEYDACAGSDPLCPCQDGDSCHYKDSPDGRTKAWAIQAPVTGEQL
jgi:hypothetical protein